MTDLAQLPEPSLIRPLDFEAILAARKAKLVELYPDIAGLIDNESEPALALLEEASYRELWLINLFNVAFRSGLLYFATGPELDHVAETYGVERLEGETDDALRLRVRIKNRGSSSAGPDDWWRYHAMRADPNVEDVAVSRPGARGHIELAILARSETGIPDQAMLERVLEVVSSDRVRNVAASVAVVAATSIQVDVSARITLEPSAISVTAEGLEADLRTAFSLRRELDWDLAPSWISAQLQQDGVAMVELLSPSQRIMAASNEALVLGNVNLELVYD